jgi:hypothetical protein
LSHNLERSAVVFPPVFVEVEKEVQPPEEMFVPATMKIGVRHEETSRPGGVQSPTHQPGIGKQLRMPVRRDSQDRNGPEFNSPRMSLSKGPGIRSILSHVCF